MCKISGLDSLLRGLQKLPCTVMDLIYEVDIPYSTLELTLVVQNLSITKPIYS